MKYKYKETKKYNGGYALPEVIVYLTLFVLMSVLVVNMLLTMSKAFSEIRANRDMTRSGSSMMERITREIQNAESIDTVNSTFGTSPGVLTLSGHNSSGTARTIKFSVSSGTVHVYENGVDQGLLSANPTTETSLLFYNITTTHGSAVRVVITLTDTRGTNVRTENFYTTAALRGSY